MIAFVTITLVALSLVAEAADPMKDRIYSLPDIGGSDLFKSAHYSGYLDTLSGRKTFYYFVESERDPLTDPLILWLNGGPGCSSLLGLFTENGPFLIRHDGKFYDNPYSWTTVANVLWMESPPGVGFSQDNCGNGTCTTWDDTITAETNYESLRAFVQAYPKFAKHDLYLTGESYAGHYVPQLAHQIAYGPDTTIRSMMQGWMVGNPCTGNYDGTNTDLCWFQNDPSLKEFFQYHAFLSFDDKLNANRTDDWGFVDINPGYDVYDIAVRFCEWNVEGAMTRKFKGRAESEPERQRQFLRNPLLADTDPEEGDPMSRYGPCNNNWLEVWLNKLDVQLSLHAKPGTIWKMCAPDANFNYTLNINNESTGVLPIYRDLMAKTNWSILVYSGDMDSRVNFIQTQKIIQSLKRPAVGDFVPWHYMDLYNNSWMQIGGFYQKYDRISWASVKGAGHMVPTNKPAPALQLLKTFLKSGAPGALPRLNETEPVMKRVQPTPIPDTYSPGEKVYIDNGGGSIAYYFGGLATGIVIGVLGVCIWHHREERRSKRHHESDLTLELVKGAK